MFITAERTLGKLTTFQSSTHKTRQMSCKTFADLNTILSRFGRFLLHASKSYLRMLVANWLRHLVAPRRRFYIEETTTGTCIHKTTSATKYVLAAMSMAWTRIEDSWCYCRSCFLEFHNPILSTFGLDTNLNMQVWLRGLVDIDWSKSSILPVISGAI